MIESPPSIYLQTLDCQWVIRKCLSQEGELGFIKFSIYIATDRSHSFPSNKMLASRKTSGVSSCST